MNREPTFKQQWVLSMAHGNLLYIGAMYTETFSFWKSSLDSEIKSFLSRMEKSGWLEQDSNRAFYRLTQKSLDWKKENPKNDVLYYYKEHEKNRVKPLRTK